MSQDEISFEELNAYVDGELDNGAAARILAALERDESLRHEVCELRALRERVRYGYGDLARASARSALGRYPVGMRHMLAASLLVAVGAATGWFGHAWQSKDDDTTLSALVEVANHQADPNRLVMHVSDLEAGRLGAALDEAGSLLAAGRTRGQPIRLEIVANSAGIELLRAGTSPYALKLARLQAEYPEEFALVACGQTLQRLQEKGRGMHLMPGVITADSALDEIVRRMRDGWSYLRV